MIVENLSTLKIHEMKSKEQYEKILSEGNIDPNAIYLTPDEEMDLSDYAEKEHAHETSDITGLQEHISISAYIDIEDNEDVPDDEYNKIDSSLSDVSENPVQNKVITEKFNELKENITTNIEEKEYHHTNISANTEITIFNNDKYNHTPCVFLGKNYFPNTKYISTNYIAYGMSYTTDGNHITIKGTPDRGTQFTLALTEKGDTYLPLPEGLNAGDSIDLHVFADKNVDNKCTSTVLRFYDENKTQLVRIPCIIDVGTNYSSKKNQTIPTGTKYLVVEFPFNTSSGSYDRTFYPIIVKNGTEAIDNLSFTDGICKFTVSNPIDNICTVPYESSFVREVELKTCVNKIVETDEMKKSSVVTPEMFGAFADNNHDDSTAIQACIDYAMANGKNVVGGGHYATNTPIIISGNHASIELKRIEYKGIDCAVVVSGMYNVLKFGFIYSPKGTGFRMKSDTTCQYNEIFIDRVLSFKNCVEYIAISGGIVGNRLTFECLEVDQNGEGDCIYQTGEDTLPVGFNHGNNNFVGGRLIGGNWAVNGAKGRDTYTTFQMEGVKNGFYYDSVGKFRVIAPRIAELWSLALDKQNGYVRVPDKGVIFSMRNPQAAIDRNNGSKGAAVSVIGCEDSFMPINIDITEMKTEYEENGTTKTLDKSYPGASLVETKLIDRDSRPIAYEFLIFGNHILIKNPAFRRIKTLEVGDIGYEGDYSVTDKDDEFRIYDEFIVNDIGCDYTLPPSYDLIAFNSFKVNQPEGTSCVFRDWRGTIIFDGATLGAGCYKVSARIKDGIGTDYYDNRNQVWDIVRQDADSESKVSLPKSNNAVNYGEAGQFAVSDGNGGVTWRTLFEGEEVAY